MRIHCQHLSKTYQTLNDQIIALADVNFTIEDNEFICIVGPSGCGKSSFVRAGLIPRIAGPVDTVIVEAAPDRTESLLADMLRETGGGGDRSRPAAAELVDLFRDRRLGRDASDERRTLIVIDQRQSD